MLSASEGSRHGPSDVANPADVHSDGSARPVEAREDFGHFLYPGAKAPGWIPAAPLGRFLPDTLRQTQRANPTNYFNTPISRIQCAHESVQLEYGRSLLRTAKSWVVFA